MTTTFFTACNRRYWPFVAPYAASVLHHNADALVEVCVEDVERYRAEHAASTEVVRAAFPDRFVLRGAEFAGRLANSVRFLEEPTVRSEHTYIGDVDILVLDSNVTALHLANMARTGLPYSNVIRPGSERLTGLHFTRTDVHYPVSLPEGMNLRRTGDEDLLYQMVRSKGLPLPDPGDSYRPVHGIHLSIRRPPVPAPGTMPSWGSIARYSGRFAALSAAPIWNDLYPTLHPAFQALVLILQTALQASLPDRDIYSPRAAEHLWDRLTS